MSDNFSRNRLRNEDAVVWLKSGVDEEGEITVSAAQGIKVRTEKKTRETLDALGNVVVTFMDINVPIDIEVGSIVWLGNKKNLPTSPTNLLQVIDNDKIPNTKGRKFDRWIGVQRFKNELPTVV